MLAGASRGGEIGGRGPHLSDHLVRLPGDSPRERRLAFDSTEIDEILTLRVMTLTDDEKAEAVPTDAAAALIIDRCDAMTPEELQRLHGVLRDEPRMTRGVEGADDRSRFGTPSEPAAFDPLFAQVPWAVDEDVPSFATPSDPEHGSLGVHARRGGIRESTAPSHHRPTWSSSTVWPSRREAPSAAPYAVRRRAGPLLRR